MLAQKKRECFHPRSLDDVASYKRLSRLDKPRFFQRDESTIFINRLQSVRREHDVNPPVQLRHKNALLANVRINFPLHALGDVLADAALFFGFTAAVDVMAGGNFSAGDLTDSRHNGVRLGFVGRGA